MNNILSRYNVSFSTPVDHPSYNQIITINGWMSQFIGDYYTISLANRLLAAVDSVMAAKNIAGGRMYTQSMQIALITSLVTNIYEDMDAYEHNNSIAPSYSLPTRDFQVIVQAWRDYLLKSPTTKDRL